MASDLRPRSPVRVAITGNIPHQLVADLALRPELDMTASFFAGHARGASNGRADVVFYAPADTVELEQRLATIRQETDAPIVLALQTEAQLEHALEQDVADIVLLPQSCESVALAIRKAARTTSGNGAVRPAKVITVFSPKGGTGKTVIATNLAAELAHIGARTLLIDLDLQFGDAAIMLGEAAQTTIFDLTSAAGEIDSDKLGGYALRHSSGLEILAAPTRPEEAEAIDEGKLRQLVTVAATAYDAVVIDTCPGLDGPLLTALDHSHELLLVCGQDVPTLKNVRLALRTLELLSVPAERISTVANRHGLRGGLTPDEFGEAVGRAPTFTLPEDDAVIRCVNRAVPVVIAEPRAPFAKAVAALAEKFVAKKPVPAPRRLWTRRSDR